MQKATIGLVFLLALLPTALFAQEPDPRALITDAQDKVTVDGMEAVTRLVTTRGSSRREQKMAMISGRFDGTEKRLIRFVEPADIRGTGFLTFDHDTGDDDMWLFLPALGKSRRIVSGEKAKSFMGSEFTYMDMTQFDPDDFIYALAGRETVDGRECWLVEQRPASTNLEREYGFSRRSVAIGVENGLMYRTLYTDLRGREWKKLEVLDMRPAGEGTFRAWHLRMTNLQNDRVSEMIVDALQLNPNPDEEYFSVRYLERE